jgi:hypothetical protein
MFANLFLMLTSDLARSQDSRPYRILNASSYSATYFADTRGAYYFQVRSGGPQVRRAIRFINIDYNGPADGRLWHKAFFDAAAQYKKDNVTFHRGGDGDFFTVSGLHISRQRIVGWYDDATDQGGYAVITQIAPDKVYYTMNNGFSKYGIADPSNFEKWKMGYEPGDWDDGFDLGTSLQLWKHGKSRTQAAVSFSCSGRLER